jgi:hypothetical protein
MLHLSLAPVAARFRAPRPRLVAYGLAAGLIVAACLLGAAQGQSPRRGEDGAAWRRANRVESASYRSGSTAVDQEEEGDEAMQPPLARSLRGERRVIPDSAVRPAAGGDEVGLPGGNGQIWKSYPLSAYTANIEATAAPQQAVVDWILRETGYEAWHSGDTFGVLWADRNELRVYHTPEMHAQIDAVVRRFTASRGELQAFGLRVVTLEEPDWRARATRLVTPIPTQTQGIGAWLLEREESALLMSDLSKRDDFREHISPNITVHNGQPYIDAKRRAVNYVKDVLPRKEGFPWFETVNSQIEEGFALEFSPLIAADGSAIDAVLKLHVDQVERIRPVDLQIETPLGTREPARVEVPQISQFKVQERFRWPADKVLLVSLGMVPAPHREAKSSFRLDFLRPPPPDRAELLLIVEAKKSGAIGPDGERTSAKPGRKYSDRY